MRAAPPISADLKLGTSASAVLLHAHFDKIGATSTVFADVRYLFVSIFWLLVPPRRLSSAFLHDGAFPHELDFSAVSWLPKLPPMFDIYIFFLSDFHCFPSPPMAHDGPDDPTAPAAYIAGHDGAKLVSLCCLPLLLLLLLGTTCGGYRC